MDKIKSFVNSHKVEILLLIIILIVGAFSRLYKIDQYLTFLGDEGRDVIIVRRIFTELHPPLIGPGTSIGNMYLGPLYYYLMAIPLLLANFDPVGPAIFVALLGVVTIFLIWFIAREWFPNSKKIHIGALIAAFLYAISPVVIIYSRSSWNPNIMPFFALVAIYAVWKFFMTQKYLWLFVSTISFAFVMQSHYLGLLIAPVLATYWLFTLFKVKENKKRFIKYSVLAAVIFFVLMSPLLIFDIRHGFRNLTAMKEFFTVRQTTVSIRPWSSLPLIPSIFNLIVTDIVAAKNVIAGQVMSVFFFIVFVLTYIKRQHKYETKNVSVIFLLTLWVAFALIGLGLYKQNIYDHYFGFIFPALFLIIAGVCNYVFSKRNYFFWAVISVLIVMITYVNYLDFPLRYHPNMQLQRSKKVAAFILDKAKGERLNLATLSERNNRDVYQYFLMTAGAEVVDTDPNAVKFTVTNQLFVVCEREKSKCDPTHDPSAWITGFGWSRIDETYEVDGLTIFKLGHNPDQK